MKIYGNAEREMPSSHLQLWKIPFYSQMIIVMNTTDKLTHWMQEMVFARKERCKPANPAETKRNVRGSVDPNVSSWNEVKEYKDQRGSV